LLAAVFLACSCSLPTSQFGAKPLEEISPELWSKVAKVSVSFYITEKDIDATRTYGEIDWFSTTSSVAMPVVANYPPNPLTLPVSILFTGITGPERELEDPVFHQEINQIISGFSWTKEQLFVDTLKQHLAFHPTIRPSYQVISPEEVQSRRGEMLNEGDIDIDIAIVINMHVFMLPQFKKSWSHPKVKLVGYSGISVSTKEAKQRQIRLMREGSLSFKNLENKGLSDQMRIQSEMKKQKFLQGTYIGSVKEDTDFAEKDLWLSEQGSYL